MPPSLRQRRGGTPRSFPRRRQTLLNFGSAGTPASSPPTLTPTKKNDPFEIVITTPSHTPQTSHPSDEPITVDSTTDDDDMVVSPAKKRGKGKDKDKTPTSLVVDDEKEEAVTTGERRSVPRSTRKARRPAGSNSSAGEEIEISSDEDFAITPRGKQRRLRDETESEDDLVVTSSARRSMRLKGNAPRKRTSNANSSDDEDGKAPKISEKKRGKRPRRQRSSEDDDDLEILPSKKRPTSSINDDEDDLEDDVALASETPVAKSRTRFAGSSSRKKSSFQRGLDELKAKREGREPTPESSSDEPQRALYDTEDESNSPQASSKPRVTSDSSEDDSEDEDNDDWIVQDDENTILGAPDMPLEFTSASHMNPGKNFRVLCHWLIRKALAPGYERDKLSVIAMRNLDSSTFTYGTSVLQSSIWKPAFLDVFKRRPCFRSRGIPATTGCDACGNRHKTSTFSVRFEGQRYDPQTFDDVDSDSDSDRSGADDYDRVFNLGKHCFNRAELAHQFCHWKKNLRDNIITELTGRGYINENGSLANKWQECTARMGSSELEGWSQDVAESLNPLVDTLYKDFNNAMDQVQRTLRDSR